MGINISTKPEVDVVNVGEEITQNQLEALTSSSNPSAANPLLTKTAADAAYVVPSTLSNYLLSSTAASTYSALGGTNTFTAANTFNIASGSTVPLTITNLGTGNSFVVNDGPLPDSSNFVINSFGDVGIGKSTPSASVKLDVAGTAFITGTISLNKTVQITHPSGHTNNALHIQNNGTGNGLFIGTGDADTTPVVVKSDRSVAIGSSTVTSGYKLDVRGKIISNDSIVASDPSYTTKLHPYAIEFSDNTLITSGPLPQFNTAVGGGAGDQLYRSTYPDEIQLKIGTYTFRMPARQVTP